MVAKNSFVLGNPELRLTRADRRITDPNLTERLSLSAGPDNQLKERANNDDELGFHSYVSCPYDSLEPASSAACCMLTGLFTVCLLAGEVSSWESN
jgi:hypothetical protein